MARQLTDKEDAFVHAVARSMKLSDAYRASRDCAKMATATINANAKKLARKPHIKARIEALRRWESRESRESPTATGAAGASAEGFALSPRREAFARFFVETSNGCEAYRRAFNVRPSTKPQTIAKRASELLADGEVTGRISELRAELARRHDVDLDRWLSEQTAIGFADITEAVEWGETIVVRDEKGEAVDERQSVRVKASKDMPPRVRAAIQSIKQTKDGGLEVKFHGKQGALDAIAKHMGWFKVDNEQYGNAAGKAAGEALAASAGGSNALLAKAVYDMLQDANAERKGAEATAALKAAIERGAAAVPSGAASEAGAAPGAAQPQAGGASEETSQSGDPDDPFPDQDPYADLANDEDGYETPR